MSETNQLLVPAAAKKDSKSFELLRVWVADQSQHVSLRAGIWDDPAAWGMMLADLAGHIANAYEQGEGMDREEALERIREGFETEWESPTDEVSGQIND